MYNGVKAMIEKELEIKPKKDKSAEVVGEKKAETVPVVAAAHPEIKPEV